jgi:spore germination cell wall hydrolase CwlJ-like protein
MKITILMIILILLALPSFAKSNHKHKSPIIPTDKLVAMTLYYEAGNQSLQGKIAVASVIWNRAEGNSKNFKYVIFSKKQFSCWNHKAKRPKITNNESYSDCKNIAILMCSGSFNVPSRLEGVNSYHERRVNPSWGKSKWLAMKIEDHLFYKIPERT